MTAVTSPRSRWKWVVGLGALVITLALTALVVSTIRKVRANAQASLITCNLAQIEAAGVQFCLESRKDHVTYDEIIASGQWLKALKPVAGENYSTIVVRPGQPVSIRTADGREFSYLSKSYR